jgi:hypothetical protein
MNDSVSPYSALTNRTISTQQWKVDGEPFDLELRYSITHYLGSGAYGVVCAGLDETSNKMIAIKKCKNM